MEPQAEAKLRKEISYLTRLIEAHKAIRSLQSDGTNSTNVTTSTTKRGTLKRVRVGSAVPSWSHSGSISCHSANYRTSHEARRTSSGHIPAVQKSTSENSRNLSASFIINTAGQSSANMPSSSPELVEDYCASRESNKLLAESSIKSSCSTEAEAMDLSFRDVHNLSEIMQEQNNSTLAIGAKRSVTSRESATLFTGPARKKRKADRLHSYSWKPNQSMSSRGPGYIPERCKLKWSKDKSITAQDVSVRDNTTILTTSYKAISMTSTVSRKRRRSSSLCVKKYPVAQHNQIHVAHDSPTFTERRLQYLLNRSIHCHSPRIKRRRLSSSTRLQIRRSKHRVWIPTKEEGINSRGFETKTKQGNKQWISEAGAVVLRNKGAKCVKSSKYKHLVNVMGGQYVMASSGKSLKRVISPATTRGVPKSSVFRKRKLSSSSVANFSMKRQRASNNMIKKSVNRVWSSKSPSSSTNDYCIFYNRFGRCNRGDECKFKHDPKRVAICSKFLRGNCDKVDGTCPFSHNVSKEKMPVCSFFLRGLCTRTNCPYLHVSVGKDAELCQNFIRGFCSLGEQCKKQHLLVCPEFSKSGTCPRGKKCPLKHMKKRLRTKSNSGCEKLNGISNRKESAISSIKEPYSFRKIRNISQRKAQNKIATDCPPTQFITPVQLEYIPLETTDVPEFIAL